MILCGLPYRQTVSTGRLDESILNIAAYPIRHSCFHCWLKILRIAERGSQAVLMNDHSQTPVPGLLQVLLVGCCYQAHVLSFVIKNKVDGENFCE